MSQCDNSDGVPSAISLSSELVICVRNGAALKAHEHYVTVPWMVPVHKQVRDLKRSLALDGGLTKYSDDVVDRLKRVADVILTQHSLYINESEVNGDVKALADKWLSSGGEKIFQAETGADPGIVASNNATIDTLANAVISCMDTRIDIGVTITFIISLLGELHEVAIKISNEANKTSRHKNTFMLSKIKAVLDPDLISIAKHPHRSTASQLKALNALRVAMATPDFPTKVYGGAGASSSPPTRAEDRVTGAMKALAISCAQIGSIDEALPHAITIRISDLRPNKHVIDCLDAIENAFGVQIQYTSTGKAKFKLLDVGKMNGLLAWTASFSILQTTSTENEWRSVADTTEGSDIRNYLAMLTESFSEHTGGKEGFMPRRNAIFLMSNGAHSTLRGVIVNSIKNRRLLDDLVKQQLKSLGGMHAVSLVYRCYHTVVTNEPETNEIPNGPIFGHYRKTSAKALSFNMAVERVGLTELFATYMRNIANNDAISRHAMLVLMQPDLCRWVQANVLSAFASAARHKAGGSYGAIKVLQSSRMPSDFKKCIVDDTDALLMMYDNNNAYDDCGFNPTFRTGSYKEIRANAQRALTIHANKGSASDRANSVAALESVRLLIDLPMLVDEPSFWTNFYHLKGSYVPNGEGPEACQPALSGLQALQDVCESKDPFAQRNYVKNLLASLGEGVLRWLAILSSVLLDPELTQLCVSDAKFKFLRTAGENKRLQRKALLVPPPQIAVGNTDGDGMKQGADNPAGGVPARPAVKAEPNLDQFIKTLEDSANAAIADLHRYDEEEVGAMQWIAGANAAMKQVGAAFPGIETDSATWKDTRFTEYAQFQEFFKYLKDPQRGAEILRSFVVNRTSLPDSRDKERVIQAVKTNVDSLQQHGGDDENVRKFVVFANREIANTEANSATFLLFTKHILALKNNVETSQTALSFFEKYHPEEAADMLLKAKNAQDAVNAANQKRIAQQRDSQRKGANVLRFDRKNKNPAGKGGGAEASTRKGLLRAAEAALDERKGGNQDGGAEE